MGEWIIDISEEPKKYVYSTYFKSLFSDLEGNLALDIGCGTGTFSFELAKSFHHVHSLDISENMLKTLDSEAHKKGINNISTTIGSADVLPYSDNMFDLVIAVGLMECLQNQKAVLQEINRVLKPGGIASIRWLNRQGVWGTVEKMRRFVGFPTGPFTNNHSSLEGVNMLLENTGFILKSNKGMILFGCPVLPDIVSEMIPDRLMKHVYRMEESNNSSFRKIKNFYYSFCTQVTK